MCKTLCNSDMFVFLVFVCRLFIQPSCIAVNKLINLIRNLEIADHHGI